MAGQEGEALGLVPEQHGAQVAVAQAHVALLGHRAGHAEGLQADADGLGGLGGGLHALLDGHGAAQGVGPAGVLKSDGLHALDDLIGVEALALAQLAGLFQAGDAVLGKTLLNLRHSSLFAFKHDVISHLLVLLSSSAWGIILLWGRCTWRRRQNGRRCQCSSCRPRREKHRGGYPPAFCPASRTGSQ